MQGTCKRSQFSVQAKVAQEGLVGMCFVDEITVTTETTLPKTSDVSAHKSQSPNMCVRLRPGQRMSLATERTVSPIMAEKSHLVKLPRSLLWLLPKMTASISQSGSLVPHLTDCRNWSGTSATLSHLADTLVSTGSVDAGS